MSLRPPSQSLSSRRRLAERGVLLLVCLVLNVGRAGPVELSRQTITLPASARTPLFVDIDGDGRADLLVLDSAEHSILNYHQHASGFSNTPDQVVPLPPQTAWIAPCDVAAHPGLELLFSTAGGLVYSRQDGGLFETQRRTLVEASQIFTDFDFPVLALVTTNKAGTNTLIPVISAGQTVLYQRNSAYEWSAGPPVKLEVIQSAWFLDLDPRLRRDRWSRRDPWTMGTHPGHDLHVERAFLANAEPRKDEKLENDSLRKIVADMKKKTEASPPNFNRLDVDGDGREDLILWQVSGKLDIKTDLYLFLRGADQKLPEQPTQILHCHGFPIPLGSTDEWSPAGDLVGDGHCELALVELSSTFITTSGAVKTALSHGMDWSLTIRPFRHGAFARNPEASLPVTAILPSEVVSGWPFFILGDFNGDGRADLLVRRSDTQWNVYFSATDGKWFAPQPALTFEAPAQGMIEITDLNGDGLSDIVWHDLDRHSLAIFLSPSRPAKGKNP